MNILQTISITGFVTPAKENAAVYMWHTCQLLQCKALEGYTLFVIKGCLCVSNISLSGIAVGCFFLFMTDPCSMLCVSYVAFQRQCDGVVWFGCKVCQLHGCSFFVTNLLLGCSCS